MEKYLATLELRYKDTPTGSNEGKSVTREITIGVFNSRDEANDAGNRVLEFLESEFELNPNYNKRERFSNTGGYFGEPVSLISDLFYLITPFYFCAKITKLQHFDVQNEVAEAMRAIDRYRKFKTNQNED